MVKQWVKDLVEEHTKEDNKINDPKIGQIVLFKAFQDGKTYKKGDTYKVEITDGQYWGTHGLSNFWYWYKLDENGNKVQEEHGYGNFYKCQ